MNPVGYWPANEGAGNVLHDLSHHGNHGRINHVKWSAGQLDFRAAFQWIEIPNTPVLQSEEFSAGGWVYLRKPLGGGREDMEGRTGMVFFGNTANDGRPWIGLQSNGFGLFIRWNELLEVVTGGELDALNTRNHHIGLDRMNNPIGQWHHLMLVRRVSGQQMQLYLNGELVAEKNGVSYLPANRAFLIGSDANWWFQANTSGSLDGSVRELVFFDRALTSIEVNRLFQISNPLLFHSPNADECERALAVLQLANSGAFGKPHAEVLAELLLADVDQYGAHLPRIENFYRNALIRTLFDVKAESEIIKQAIGRAFVEPLVARLDSTEAGAKKIFDALKNNQPLKALGHYNALTNRSHQLLSRGDELRNALNPTDYTPQTEHNGFVFKVGTGEPWEGVEVVTPNQYRTIADRLVQEFPEAVTWRQPDAPNLYRIPLTRFDPDGTSQTVYLEGADFVLDGTDAKLRGWSIALDKEGYIHLTGGMHNTPNPTYYIPGTWERMGLSRDRNSPDFPAVMVWVSAKPYDIQSLEFVGKRDNPKCPPVPDGLNYMNFVQDRNGELYLYGRIIVSGIQSWGLYRYNTPEKKWSAIGGQALKIVEDLLATTPEWATFFSQGWGQSQMPEIDGPISLAWAWQPHFYNYMRDPRGVQFDLENRMHAWLRLFGINSEGQLINSRLYAYSDDEGRTFRRVNGKPVELPLTLNPAPGHQSDALPDQAEIWWQLWISLFLQAGYSAD